VQETLQNCPFCGGEVVVNPDCSYQACGHCAAEGPYGRCAREGIERWNFRMPSGQYIDHVNQWAATYLELQTALKQLDRVSRFARKAKAAADVRLEAIKTVQEERNKYRSLSRVQTAIHDKLKEEIRKLALDLDSMRNNRDYYVDASEQAASDSIAWKLVAWVATAVCVCVAGMVVFG